MTRLKHSTLFGLMLATSAYGENDSRQSLPEALVVDRSIVGKSEINFPNDDNIHPHASDFNVVSTILMSGENGERWATITVQNNSSGQRLLQKDYLLVLFANGERKMPKLEKTVFKGKEKITLNVSLGYHKFPALSVYSANDE